MIGLIIWYSIGVLSLIFGILYVDKNDLKLKDLLLSFICGTMGLICTAIVIHVAFRNGYNPVIIKVRKRR